MWSGDKKHEPRTKTGVRGLSARPGRVDGSELAGACGICEAIPQGNGCAAIASTLAGNGRNGARPVCPRALRNAYFFVAGSGRSTALNTDGGVDRRTGGIFGRRLGADGDGG